ncbi:beta-lactamase/transpeptidase-like protein [Meredithblackwellia eburnea MCA 4105]
MKDDFQSYLDELLQEWKLPGAAVAVYHKGQVEFFNSGTAGGGRKMDENTVMGIASNSKAMTAAGVGILVDRGLMKWESKMEDLIPGFSLPPTLQGKPDVRDLLSHRTGMPRHENGYPPGRTMENIVQSVKHLKPSAEFRETFQYTNIMYITAGYLVPKLTSHTFTSFMTSEIFKPLGMTSTGYIPNATGQLSAGYETLLDESVYERSPLRFEDNLEIWAAPGGVHSCSKDMIKWVEFLVRSRNAALHPPEEEENKEAISTLPKNYPLKPETVLQMSTAHMTSGARGAYPELSQEAYGLGLVLCHYQGNEYVKHGGDLPGNGSQVLWSSELDFGVVALTNSTGSGNRVANSICFRAFEDIANVKRLDWTKRNRAEQEKYVGEIKKKLSEAQARVEKPTKTPLSLPPRNYWGDFLSSVYQEAHVLPLDPDKLRDAPPDLKNKSAKMLDRLSRAKPMGPQPPSSETKPTFLIDYPSYLGLSHMLVTQEDGDKFVGSWGYINDPIGDRKEPYLTYSAIGEIEVEFIVQDGKVTGMEWGGVWGAGEAVAKKEKESGKGVEIVFNRASS